MKRNRYRPGVHEACLTQFLRVVRCGLRAQYAAYGAPLARAIAAALALNPNQHFTFLPDHTLCFYVRTMTTKHTHFF